MEFFVLFISCFNFLSSGSVSHIENDNKRKEVIVLFDECKRGALAAVTDTM